MHPPQPSGAPPAAGPNELELDVQRSPRRAAASTRRTARRDAGRRQPEALASDHGRGRRRRRRGDLRAARALLAQGAVPRCRARGRFARPSSGLACPSTWTSRAEAASSSSTRCSSSSSSTACTSSGRCATSGNRGAPVGLRRPAVRPVPPWAKEIAYKARDDVNAGTSPLLVLRLLRRQPCAGW